MINNRIVSPTFFCDHLIFGEIHGKFMIIHVQRIVFNKRMQIYDKAVKNYYK